MQALPTEIRYADPALLTFSERATTWRPLACGRMANTIRRGSLFDTNVLAARMTAAADTLLQDRDLGRIPVGYLTAGHACSAAVIAAVERPLDVTALVGCS